MNPQAPQDPLERRIGEALGAAEAADVSTFRDCDEPDAVRLAEYLDDVLDAASRRQFEAHLASCSTCRQLAMACAPAVESHVQESTTAPFPVAQPDVDPAPPSPRRRSPSRRWPLALAAGLAALSVGLWFSPEAPPPGEEPTGASTAAGPAETAENADDDAARIGRILDGRLTPVAAFDALLDDAQRPVLRGASGATGPQPLAPRWSVIVSTRPQFQWSNPDATSASTGSPQAAGNRRTEIYLVDDAERLVATWPCDAPTTPRVTCSFPAESPPLDADRLYAWKVNRWLDDGIESSNYVPFWVDPSASQRQPEPTADDDLRLLHRAALLADTGRLHDALTALGRLESAAQRATAEPLLAAIFRRQRLPENLIDQERRRLGWQEPTATEGSPP